jgi:cytochrome c oxidase subunit 3/cytochrome o ubiquinol oxidase subunit 3
LIYEEGLTIQTNLFGTTYYSLVGLHAFHVTVGFIALSTVSLFGLLGHVRQEHGRVTFVSHFVWMGCRFYMLLIGVACGV